MARERRLGTKRGGWWILNSATESFQRGRMRLPWVHTSKKVTRETKKCFRWTKWQSILLICLCSLISRQGRRGERWGQRKTQRWLREWWRGTAVGLADSSRASGRDLDLNQIGWCARKTQCIYMTFLKLWGHKSLLYDDRTTAKSCRAKTIIVPTVRKAKWEDERRKMQQEAFIHIFI